MTWLAYLILALWERLRGRRSRPDDDDESDEPKYFRGFDGGWGAMPSKPDDDEEPRTDA